HILECFFKCSTNLFFFHFSICRSQQHDLVQQGKENGGSLRSDNQVRRLYVSVDISFIVHELHRSQEISIQQHPDLGIDICWEILSTVFFEVGNHSHVFIAIGHTFMEFADLDIFHHFFDRNRKEMFFNHLLQTDSCLQHILG